MKPVDALLADLALSAAAFMERGIIFARDDDPHAYALAQRMLGGTPGARLELRIGLQPDGGEATVAAFVVDAGGEAIAQVFAIDAAAKGVPC